MFPRNRLSLLLVALLIGAVLLYWESPERFLRPLAPELRDEQPDAFILGAVSTQFDAQGNREYQLEAARVTHFQQQNRTDLEQPFITFYEPGQPPWFARANAGRADSRGEQLHLWGDVQIWQINAAGERSELTTSELWVEPDRQFAHTDKAVKIVTAAGQTEAVGMEAWFDQQRVKLLANVRGEHAGF